MPQFIGGLSLVSHTASSRAAALDGEAGGGDP
jgi:hypothetical protein